MTTKTQTIQERAAEALDCFESVKREREGAHIVTGLLDQLDGIGIPDWAGAEGLYLDDARSWLDQSGESYYRMKDGSPQWVTDLCHAAHEDGTQGGMLPDDWRYAFIVEALRLLSNCDERDLLDEQVDMHLEPDTYNSELFAWLASYGTRFAYCDECVEEYGGIESFHGDVTMKLIAGGQLQEKREVLGLVLGFLRGEEG